MAFTDCDNSTKVAMMIYGKMPSWSKYLNKSVVFSKTTNRHASATWVSEPTRSSP